tara:strand:+ start:964 stop:1755 length:792 start_codon:yes stop_codon:yes gene_type:complete
MFKLIIVSVLPLILTGCFQQRKAETKNVQSKKHFLEYTVKKEDYVPGVYDGNPEPPYPDLAEDVKTLEGIDADKDGFRDDLEIWINRNGKTSNVRNLLRQSISSDLSILKSKDKENGGRRMLHEMVRTGGCLSLIANADYEEISNLMHYLRKYLKNTRARQSLIRETFNNALPANSITLEPQEIFFINSCLCDFEIDRKDEALDRFRLRNKSLMKLTDVKIEYFFQVLFQNDVEKYYQKHAGINDLESCIDPRFKKLFAKSKK